jgi:hypothetical protein
MALFTAAAAAAIERPAEGSIPGIYSYPTELEFNVKSNGRFAPSIVVKILAQLLLDEPDVVFTDSKGHRIMVEDFPKAKIEFDDVFCTTTAGGRLSCKFEIRSSRHSFHAVKIGVWDILQTNQVWFKKTPGPVQKTPLTAIGFWMNIHPGFASSRVFHTQVTSDIKAQYEKQHDIISPFTLPNAYEPVEFYFSRQKINADYPSKGATQKISTDAFMAYVPSASVDRAMVYLTKISSLRKPNYPTDTMFIPLIAKYQNPDQFSQYVAQHTEFLNNHRNIAVVGLDPDAMDMDTPMGENIWESIKTLPGVFRCDPCRRTPDLGKWNISCAQACHTDICAWIDDNLIRLWESLPNKNTIPTISAFPFPERLSKGRKVSSNQSVTSGLTNASPVGDYLRQLESNLPSRHLPATTIRNVWKPTSLPVADITYTFNSTEFPHLPDNDKPANRSSTVITAQETGSVTKGTATAVSAITEELVSNTVRSSITEFENRRKLADVASNDRMNRLEQQVGAIDNHVKHMAKQLQKVVVEALTASEERQQAHTAQQDTKIDRLESIVEKMATSIQELLADNRARDNDTEFFPAQSHDGALLMHTPDRPIRSPRDREKSHADKTSDDCTSPDRQRQKLNQGVPTERGTGTRGE